MNRYTRQMMLPEIGTVGQKRLREAKVLVVGAGGLAAPLLPILSGAGVGHITIIDGDTVELSNLHRQTLFTEADCGQYKAVLAAKRCCHLNHETRCSTLTEPLTPHSAQDLVGHVDIVLDCADSYAVSYMLSDICLRQRVPLISASVLRLDGYVGGFCASAPSLRAVFPQAPAQGANCATAGVLGSVVAMIGAMQAHMALAWLLQISPSPLGQMLQWRTAEYRFSGFRFDHAPEPDTYFPFIARRDIRDTDRVVDLRGEDESPVLLHPSAERIPQDRLQVMLTNHQHDVVQQRLVLCCASGLRAWRAAEAVAPYWQGEVALLAASAC